MRKVLISAMAASTASLMGVSGATQAAQPGAAAAQQQPQQEILPPEARYWIGATTGGGMLAMAGMGAGGRPSMSSMMRMASGGMPTEGRSIELKIGSTLSATGEPEAFHAMPPGAQVNKPIFLQTPEPGRRGSSPDTYQQPKGQISFYWGCGEKAGPGQPVVLTFDKLMRGENEPELEALQGSVAARGVRKPTPGNSKTYADWPHEDRKKRNEGLEASFPVGSTLAGPHVIEGNFTPKIGFTLPADKSFMEAVRYTATNVLPSGAIAVNWNAPARATGYSLGVMAPERVGDDSANFVMWSSADRPATFIQMEYLTPAEVNRLIGLKAVLPATTTTCTVPAEVVKATRDGSMLMFTAYGDEATFIHPARPADVKVTWDQEWFARVGFKSVRMDMISPQGVTDPLAAMAGAGAAGDAAAPDAAPEAMSDEDYCRQIDAQQADKPSLTDAIPGGSLLKKFGRKGGQEPPSATDPRCANLKKE